MDPMVAPSWSFSISSSSEYSGLISSRIDWFDLLAVQGTLKSLLQHHNLKASILCHSTFFLWASLMTQLVKNLPAVQKTWVQSLGWEDPLEKEMATHSSVLDWRIPVTAELGGLPSMGSHRVGHDCSNLAAACLCQTFLASSESLSPDYLSVTPFCFQYFGSFLP